MKGNVGIVFKYYGSKKALKEIQDELRCSAGTASQLRNGTQRVKGWLSYNRKFPIPVQVQRIAKHLELLKCELEYLERQKKILNCVASIENNHEATDEQLRALRERFASRIEDRKPFVIENDEVRKILFPVPSYSISESDLVYSAARNLFKLAVHNNIPCCWEAVHLFIENEAMDRVRLLALRVSEEEALRRSKLNSSRSFSDATIEQYHYFTRKMKSEKELMLSKIEPIDSEKVLANYESFVKFFTGRKYRFVILSGSPYSGKTRFAKYWIRYWSNN